MMLQERTEPRGWFWTFPCFTTVLGLSVPLNSLVKLSTWENTCLARSWNKNPVPGFSWVILETFPYEQKSLGVQGEHTLGEVGALGPDLSSWHNVITVLKGTLPPSPISLMSSPFPNRDPHNLVLKRQQKDAWGKTHKRDEKQASVCNRKHQLV